jgi:hypothetical protein
MLILTVKSVIINDCFKNEGTVLCCMKLMKMLGAYIRIGVQTSQNKEERQAWFGQANEIISLLSMASSVKKSKIPLCFF